MTENNMENKIIIIIIIIAITVMVSGDIVLVSTKPVTSLKICLLKPKWWVGPPHSSSASVN